MMDVAAFLRRIGYVGSTAASESTLQALHRAFVIAVPFENLDIHLGRRIVLDENEFFQKIVVHHRGGFCYELNGLFAALLRALGFDVTLLSARVIGDSGEAGREFAHLLLLVRLERRWIADVGFGDWSPDPIALPQEGATSAGNSSFRITSQGERFFAERWDQTGARWKPRHTFTLASRCLSDFADMCNEHQTAGNSAFRRQRMCTRATTDGRITLTEDKLIITARGERNEITVDDQTAYYNALSEHFKITLPPESLVTSSNGDPHRAK